MVVGKYNDVTVDPTNQIDKTKGVFIVGSGAELSGGVVRQNAIRVREDGTVLVTRRGLSMGVFAAGEQP